MVNLCVHSIPFSVPLKDTEIHVYLIISGTNLYPTIQTLKNYAPLELWSYFFVSFQLKTIKIHNFPDFKALFSAVLTDFC